jgi:hypothetical protein
MLLLLLLKKKDMLFTLLPREEEISESWLSSGLVANTYLTAKEEAAAAAVTEFKKVTRRPR